MLPPFRSWYIQSILLHEGIEQKIPHLLKFVKPEIEDKESYIKEVAQKFDPTPNAEYITWILKLLYRNILRGDEDADKTTELLQKFNDLKIRRVIPPEGRDINKYKTYGDLARYLDDLSTTQSKKESKRIRAEEGIKSMGQLSDRHGDTYELFIVTTDEAGAKHFRNTSWCVKDPDYFNQYGGPFFFFTKNNNPHTLIHLNSEQCMDVYDSRTQLKDVEVELMESEEVTDYVLITTKSEKELSFYVSVVGSGHDGRIKSYILDICENMIREANKKLTLFKISDNELMETYDDTNYFPTATAYIKYDLGPYVDVFDDHKFITALESALGACGIWVSDDWLYVYPLEEVFQRGIFIAHIQYDDGYLYEKSTYIRRTESFIEEVESADGQFDIDEFSEVFEEKLQEAGFIKSGWVIFHKNLPKEKISLKNFLYKDDDPDRGPSYYAVIQMHLPQGKPYIYPPNFTITDTKKLFKFHFNDITRHPYLLLAKFLEPIIQAGISVHYENRHNCIILKFVFKTAYHADKTSGEYMKAYKMAKNIDTHFVFYEKQINAFFQRYIHKYYSRTEKEAQDVKKYDIPKDTKLPVLKLKTYKDHPDQEMLDLHESIIKYLYGP
jgi:hypothetical protein